MPSSAVARSLRITIGFLTLQEEMAIVNGTPALKEKVAFIEYGNDGCPRFPVFGGPGKEAK